MKNKSYTMTKLSGWLASLLILLGLWSNVGFAQTTVQIGTGTSTTTSFPIRSCYGYSYTQMLYTSAEIAAGGYSGSGSITKIRFYYAAAAATPSTYNNWTVYLGNTALTTLTAGAANYVPASSMSMCFSGIVTFPAAGNWMEITLSTPFTYSGGNLIVAVDENAASYSCSAAWRYTSTGSNQVIQLYSDTYNPDPALLPGSYSGSSTSGLTKPNIQLDINSLSGCTGTPTPGNTISSVASTCSGTSFSLSLQNATTGSGVSYQWQSSPDGSSWSNFGTNASSQSVSQTSATYYQCLVTCSGNTGTSNPILVSMISGYTCYCTASATSTSYEKISNVSFNTINNPSSSTAGFEDFTAISTTVEKGSTYTFTGTISGAYSTDMFLVWIDYNQDGDFNDANETVYTSAQGVGPHSGNITIDLGALTGTTYMRVRMSDASSGHNSTPCGTHTYGQVEDYALNIVNPVPCVDPPTAGSATSTLSQFCNSGSANITLDLTGNTIGAGQTYQWEYSFDDVNWVPMSGAITKSYATNVSSSTFFHCLVTCGANTGTSSSVFVEAVEPPVAGVISGPSSVYANQPAVYTSIGENGSLQWQARLLPSGTFSNVSGATNNPQTIYFSSTGSYELQLVTSVPGCTSEISNAVTTVVTIQNDNVCNAIPVNIGLNGPYTNVGATTEPGEPVPPGTSCNGNGSWCNTTLTNSVWFTFTVPTGGSGRYGFAAPAWDSQIAIYKAAACGDILTGGSTLWAANDDSSGSPYNAYARGFCLEEGETVYIQLDGYSGTNGAFAIRIDDFGPAADASFSGLPAAACSNGSAVTLNPVTAGGTFSGPGVSGSSFDPSAAGAGTHVIYYNLGDLDTCVSTSQTVVVSDPSFTYYGDADGDNYGDGEVTIASCDAVAPAGYSADNTDCDDGDVSVNPGASEVCNGIDDDCNGIVDNGFDNDNDGYTSCNGDCDDNNASVYPGATEVCNGIDDDCNLSIDDGLTFITYYADVDGDTYGDAGNTVSTCNGAPSGYVSDNTDCNDNNASANPAGTEVCNTIDDDCDGLIDENVLVAGPISGPAVQCVAVVTGSATFSIASVADASTYTWTVPAGMTILSGQGTNSIFVSWTPSAASTGIIGNMTVTPNNACGAGVSSSVLVDINYTKPVMPNSISGPVKVCPGDVATYSTNLIARASYFVWSVPAGMTITSGASSNVITVSVGAGYTGGTVSVSAANGCGAGPARLRAVALNTPGVSASISGQASGVCGASGVSYTAAAVVGATSYNWTVPAGASIISGQGSASISVDFTGSYAGGSISVVASNACGSGAARSLTVSGAPGQPGIISGDQTICPGQSNVPYSVSTVAGASVYTWSVPSIASIASGQGTKDIYVNWGTNPTSGQQVTVYASNGCGNGPVRILNGISVDLGNCVRIGETGAATGLNIFPNPATEMATIVFNGTEGADFNMTMVDVAGRVVMTERGTAVDGQNQRNVVVSEMASGVYFLTIQINGASEQIRVMVD